MKLQIITNKLKNYKTFLLLFILIFVLGFFSTYYVFDSYNMKLEVFFNNLDNFLFMVIPFITISNLFIRFFRWNFLIRTFQTYIPSRELLTYYMISYLGNATPLYVFYIFRTVPLLKRKILKGFGIFLIDLIIDFIVIISLYFFYKNIYKFIYIFSILFLFTFLIHFNLRNTKKINSYYYLSAFLLTLSLTYLIWIFTSLSFILAFKSFGIDFSYIDSAYSLALMNLSNFFSIIPGGIFISGTNIIQFFIEKGIYREIALSVVFLERILTVWFTIFISFISLIIFRKRFILSDYHFNNIADEYTEQIPEHVKDQVLKKKIEINLKYLPKEKFLKGLDAGCGQGWYLKEMIHHGYDIVGIDYSQNQVKKAKEYTGSHKIQVASIISLPFKDKEFDFIYTINVLHHLPNKESIKKALEEFHRVSKKGSRLIIHEINVLNPLYRFYMSYVFPIIKMIDEGTEIWIDIEDYKDILEKYKIVSFEYFTFLPDFLPSFLFKILVPIERLLEKSKLKRFSAHYAIILEKL